MLGYGRTVGIVQFIKGAWHTGEKDAFAAFGNRVKWHTMGEGFTWETQDLARDKAAAERAFDKARELMDDPAVSLVILDELNIALRYEYLDLNDVIDVLTSRRPDLHVVITGRNAKPALIEAADLVTEMQLVKHHFRGRRESAGRHRVLSASTGAGRAMARALMFQGTGSDVGKSLLVSPASPAPLLTGPEGPPLQAAEHVKQCRRNGGRR